MKKKCNHYVGIWYELEYTDLLSISDLIEKMVKIKDANNYRKSKGYDKRFLAKEYTLKDYFDKRKNCNNFSPFSYCPKCGEEIKYEQTSKKD